MPQMRYRRRFGDRVEGRLLRSLDYGARLAPFFSRNPTDASVFFADGVDSSYADRFLRRIRGGGFSGAGMLHLFIAAYVRTVAMNPALNRFVSGQRIYARHSVDVVINLKRSSRHEAATRVKVRFDASDTIYDVYRRIDEKIDSMRAGDGTDGFSGFASALLRFPRPMLRLAAQCLRFLDYFGKLPQSLLEASPFHGSLIIGDLGSAGAGPVYRQLNNIGNIPVSLSFGTRRRAVELSEDGAPVENKLIDYSLVLDCRICEGHYHVSAMKYFKHFLHNPELLELPPDKIHEDIF